MEYIEIQTLGNALDFGDIVTTGNSQCDGMNSPTRGFFQGGGYPVLDNSIAMFTIASKGNAIDFGETIQNASYKRNVSSTTRGIACGGRISYPAGPFSDTIEYITMASAGNAIDFGNLTQARHSPAGAGTLTRGVFCGGYTFTTAPSTTSTNTMDYITIASTGDAIDFGDLTFAKEQGQAVSSPTRFVSMSGRNSSSNFIDEMDFVQIMTLGDAIDFGEIVGSDRFRSAAASNGHGGL